MKINDLLRWQVREKAGRSEDPSLVVIDAQSVHVTVNVPVATTGKDAAKKVPGRRRGLAVDVLGLVIAVTVLAASTHDNAFGIALLGRRTRAGARYHCGTAPYADRRAHRAPA
nr:transposase [Streptomyces sp. 2132.2]